MSSANTLQVYAPQERTETLRSRLNPQVSPYSGWMDELQRCWSPHAASARSWGCAADAAPSFLPILAPVIAAAKAQLGERAAGLLGRYRNVPFDPHAVSGMLVPLLVIQALQLAERTLALELNVARLCDQLQGDDARTRFASFVRQMSQPERALALFGEYPLLAQGLLGVADLWVQSSAELLERLAADWTDILATFNEGRHPGAIVQIEGSGDTHRGGRRVLSIRFDSGFRVVYKPRSLALDQHFQQLLSWLNAQGEFPHLRTLGVIDRGSHGWVEFVHCGKCTDDAQVRRFYWRQGANLAVLYALGGADFHAENVIADGEFPVLIDLEALFHAPAAAAGGHTSYNKLLRDGMDESVLRSGLLPQRSFASNGAEGVDLSGLGSRPQELTPDAVPRWQGVGTDEMRLVRTRVPIGISAHLPRLAAGTAINVADHVEDIVCGFQHVYRLLREHRDELFAPGQPLAAFAGDETRIVLRASRTYAKLLHDSAHPDMLREALAREKLFERLESQAIALSYPARVLDAERADLERRDIPIFTGCPSSLDLLTSDGERIEGFLSTTSLAAAQRRIGAFDEHDLERQTWLIRASIASSVQAPPAPQSELPGAPAVRRSQSQSRREPLPEATRSDLLIGAQQVGDRLQALAVRSRDTALWFGLFESGPGEVGIAPCGLDLYAGLGGVSLFLALLARATGQERYEQLARASFRCLQEAMREYGAAHTSIGGFEGWGSYLYTLSALGSLWSEAALLDEAQECVSKLPDLIEKDEQFDVISGSAGCIGALLALYRLRPVRQTLAVAEQCAERLIDNARETPVGLGWQAKQQPAGPLSGFAHGAAGIAWALLKLHAIRRSARYLAVARGAIDYERSLFSEEACNWRDMRRFTGAAHEAPGYATAWCHGAPGIALARASTLEVLDDPLVRAEIRNGLQATLHNSAGGSDCLCHGELGNLLILTRLRTLAGNDLGPASLLSANDTLVRLARGHWRCGNRMQGDQPGLLTGLAGLGYGLLALADPGSVPFVLTLEPFL